MAILQVNAFSNALMRTVTFQVVLPMGLPNAPEQPQKTKLFPTLYLLHGIFGNQTDWLVGTRVARWAAQWGIAVVMPAGDNHFYVDCAATGEKYGEFIGQELPALCEAMFPLSAKREDRFIAGLSMGGYGALRNGLKYHENFGAIAALSAALILQRIAQSDNSSSRPTFRRSYYEGVFGPIEKLPGSDMDYNFLAKALKESGAPLPRIFIACGVDDALLAATREYRDYLQSLGIPCTYEEGPGAHEWDFWDRYILRVLDWLAEKP